MSRKSKSGAAFERSIRKQVHEAVQEMPADIKRGLEGYERVRQSAQEALTKRPPLPGGKWSNVTLV